MNFDNLKPYEFFFSVGYVTLIASVLTLVITQLIKKILTKKGILYEGMEQSKRDMFLSRIGRIVALLSYVAIYLINAFLTKHTLVLDKSLLAGLLSGASLTLVIAKSIYTSLHQYFKKKNVFERLECLEKVIDVLENEVNQDEKEKVNKWLLTNNK